jgi:phosphoribosylformimino-5-aminoimidazole carboxamide ribonucleotide (ProFAR) isomerase
VARAADGVAGVIVGRALYTGAVRLEDALGLAAGAA